MFLKNRNISSKIKRSKATDYAALIFVNIRYIPGYMRHIYRKEHHVILLHISERNEVAGGKATPVADPEGVRGFA